MDVETTIVKPEKNSSIKDYEFDVKEINLINYDNILENN